MLLQDHKLCENETAIQIPKKKNDMAQEQIPGDRKVECINQFQVEKENKPTNIEGEYPNQLGST